MTSRIKSVLGLIGAALFTVFFVTAQSPVTKAQGNETEDLYNHKCAICHARDGSGNTSMGKKLGAKDVRVTVKKYSEDEMITAVQKGKGDNMSSFSDELSPEQIKAVVEYYRGLAKSKK